jgi:hypothetical protein
MNAGVGGSGDLEGLAEAFADLVEAMMGEFDVHELLQVLADRCVDVLDVSAAGLMLASSDGGLQVMVASNEQAKLVELFQIQHDEGLCLESYRSGAAIVAVGRSRRRRRPRLPRRWPMWPRLRSSRSGSHRSGWR